MRIPEPGANFRKGDDVGVLRLVVPSGPQEETDGMSLKVKRPDSCVKITVQLLSIPVTFVGELEVSNN